MLLVFSTIANSINLPVFNMQGSHDKPPVIFCSLCLVETDNIPAPSTQRINGIGTTWLGTGAVCPVCGSCVRSHWFTVLWIPLIPLGKYRIITHSGVRYIGRKLSAAQKPMPWWHARMRALPPGLVPLAVVKVRADTTPQQNKTIGALLNRWKSENPQVHHIWGVDELCEGAPPRSPCEYFLISRHPKDIQEGNEAVALVIVQPDADMDRTGNSLAAALLEVKASLVSLTDLDNYCYQNR